MNFIFLMQVVLSATLSRLLLLTIAVSNQTLSLYFLKLNLVC